MSSLDAEFSRILDGAAAHDEILDFLARSVAWMKDATALAAGAAALRERMVRVAAPPGAIDVCGTGGDGAHTLNISTAVAFVVAGCGVTVAKHGNRAMSSQSGAADVLEALGVKLVTDGDRLERCLREARIAFLFAQHHHPALRHVAAARREFGRRTIFNLLGPLANPAGVRRQLLGVFAQEFAASVGDALHRLGCEKAWVVHGFGGLDELSCAGENAVIEVDLGGARRRDMDLANAGIRTFGNDTLRGGSADENAAALKDLLSGRTLKSDYAEIVRLNAGAALVVAGAAADLPEGVAMASESLGAGHASTALEALVALTNDRASETSP